MSNPLSTERRRQAALGARRKLGNLRCPARQSCDLGICPHRERHSSRSELTCTDTPCPYQGKGTSAEVFCRKVEG